MIFSFVVLGVAIMVTSMYVRHGRFMRAKRAAELAAGTAPPPSEPDDAH